MRAFLIGLSVGVAVFSIGMILSRVPSVGFEVLPADIYVILFAILLDQWSGNFEYDDDDAV